METLAEGVEQGKDTLQTCAQYYLLSVIKLAGLLWLLDALIKLKR